MKGHGRRRLIEVHQGETRGKKKNNKSKTEVGATCWLMCASEDEKRCRRFVCVFLCCFCCCLWKVFFSFLRRALRSLYMLNSHVETTAELHTEAERNGKKKRKEKQQQQK
eukprot:TRINITY_DN3299_c0_g3_i1.p5 TRINITY_DN3299_c0_g3~~TRINITY_DN3299_c0_g3_i1.p5  ORF type:complete len:110 (+),score=9.65 TRINITY_DN3299_c0_g3_i1:408-737(+)